MAEDVREQVRKKYADLAVARTGARRILLRLFLRVQGCIG